MGSLVVLIKINHKSCFSQALLKYTQKRDAYRGKEAKRVDSSFPEMVLGHMGSYSTKFDVFPFSSHFISFLLKTEVVLLKKKTNIFLKLARKGLPFHSFSHCFSNMMIIL